MALVEQLKGPMMAQGGMLKQYLKDTLLPAYNNIKATHGELDDKGKLQSRLSVCTAWIHFFYAVHAVDLAFGAGLLTFDEVCKKVERIALRDEDELKTAQAESKVCPPGPSYPG